MDQVEQQSMGWRPSPGSVYPLLEELAHEGLISRRPDGRYEVTSKGKESVTGPWDFFSRRPATLGALLEEMNANVAYLEDLRATQSVKLTPHVKAIQDLASRLSRLGSS